MIEYEWENNGEYDRARGNMMGNRMWIIRGGGGMF